MKVVQMVEAMVELMADMMVHYLVDEMVEMMVGQTDQKKVELTVELRVVQLGLMWGNQLVILKVGWMEAMLENNMVAKMVHQ